MTRLRRRIAERLKEAQNTAAMLTTYNEADMSAVMALRQRYRESFETPRAIAPDMPLPYRFALPTANHVFLPGHRIMVQVQSSWFPLYDRNPQTFVPNIFQAKPGDYRKATQRVYTGGAEGSRITFRIEE